jgi:hypothetical protein
MTRGSSVPGGGGYRVPAPGPGAALPLPAAFGTRFAIFVDTEEQFDWGAGFRRDCIDTSAIAALPVAHARFADHGVPLTYLIDYPVATAPPALAILRRLIEDGRSAIGTQLHPWVNPPFDEPVTAANSFAGNLAPELERAKLARLTDAIEAGLGARPMLYRAGRYGIGPHTLATLAALGYRFDSSMRAAYDYRPDGPDFGAVGNDAFVAGHGIVELPLTTVFTGWGRSGGVALDRMLGALPCGRGAAARLGCLSRVALTPEDMPIGEALEAVRIAVGEGVRLLNFSFHSPSLEPGHTPYVRDAADLAAFYDWWERIFALLRQLGVAPASLAEIDTACSEGRTSARAGRAGGL